MLGPGTVDPQDWGFVPGTAAEDGDPVDAFLIGAAGTFPGIVIRARPIGLLKVEQREAGERFRNDRLIFVPWQTAARTPISDVRELRRDEKDALQRLLRACGGGHGEGARFSRLARRQGRRSRDQARLAPLPGTAQAEMRTGAMDEKCSGGNGKSGPRASRSERTLRVPIECSCCA